MLTTRNFDQFSAWLLILLGVLLGAGALGNVVALLLDGVWAGALLWAALTLLFGFGVYRGIHKLRSPHARGPT